MAGSNLRATMAYGLTIFLSALLLFQVQFILGKHLLPWFGGAPMVWSTCLVFFQSMLLAGYAYAHWLARRRSPRAQALIHTAMLGAGALWLGVTWRVGGVPVLTVENLKPDPYGFPVLQLLAALATSVSLPFLLLAATSPLVQHWHAQAGQPLDRTYRLYALSNVGSLLGLISYPFAIEAWLDLNAQAWIWTALFVLFAIGCMVVAWRPLRSSISPAPAAAASEPLAAPPVRGIEGGAAPGWKAIALWIALPLAASLMLAATTNRISQDVAVVPFLWMAPLALYLVTFIISFDRPQWYSRRAAASAAVMTGIVLYTAARSASIELVVQLAVFCTFLFFFCLVCHGELARLRPGRAHLTLYYLSIAAGGAFGAAAVSIAAPLVFDDYWEFHLGILLGWLVIAVAWRNDRSSPLFRGDRLHFVLVAGMGVFALVSMVLGLFPRFGGERYWLAGAFAVNIAVLLGLALWKRTMAQSPHWSRVFVALVIALAGITAHRVWSEGRENEIRAGRNFYGVLRLRVDSLDGDRTGLHLTHGRITHGVQIRNARERMVPTTYYTPRSGVGRAIAALREHKAGAPLHLGVLGLGTGTLAAYAQRDDRVRFYEINPLVTMLSFSEPAIFTFVRGSAGTVDLVAGDARLALEAELISGEPQQFDLLAVDVFSSDAIPVHLITLEAGVVYRTHLRDEHSILAVHTSNRFLELEPVLVAIGARLGWHAVMVLDDGQDIGAYSSTWVLLSRNPELLNRIMDASDDVFPLGTREVLFTDRYSNLFRILN